MQLKDMRLLFQNGVIQAASVCPGVLDNSDKWQVMFHTKKGDMALQTQRGGIRHFRTLEAARAAVDEVGLKRINVIW